MAADRYVLLGLASVRARWFGEVARWSTSATIPVDFVKVVSAEEARTRLRSGRAFSALLVDAGLHGLDRDLVELAAEHGCAVDAAVEGDEQCGSTDVEDRNTLARLTLGTADLVLVVGVPGVAGVHAQLRVIRDLLELGVPASRLVPVVNRAPRSARLRAELGRALTDLLGAAVPGTVLASSPVFVPERRRL